MSSYLKANEQIHQENFGKHQNVLNENLFQAKLRIMLRL